MTDHELLQMMTYSRKPFNVNATQLTLHNAEAVVEWCGGTLELFDAKIMGTTAKLPCVNITDGANQYVAFIGDWIVERKRSFRVYKDRAFRATFDVATAKEPSKPLRPHMLYKELQVVGVNWIPMTAPKIGLIVRIENELAGAYHNRVGFISDMKPGQFQVKLYVNVNKVDPLADNSETPVDVVYYARAEELKVCVEDMKLGNLSRYAKVRSTVAVNPDGTPWTGVVDCFLGETRDVLGDKYVKVLILNDYNNELEAVSSKYLEMISD